MGKKGSWFSAIKRVFTPSSKDKLEKASSNKSEKEKKKGRGILGYGETKSFIPFFRQPSSIEKILEEVDKNNLFIMPNTTLLDQQETPPSLPLRPSSPTVVSSPRVIPPAAVSSPRYEEVNNRPEPNLKDPQLSAIKIQAAYRGYKERRSFRTLKGLVRLQRVVKGQNVKRQTTHAIKQMQLLVRAQTQVRTRRIQMLENQSLHSQFCNNSMDKESETTLSKSLRSQLCNNNVDKESKTTLSKFSVNQLSEEAGDREEWDNSLVKREEAEGKMQRKVEAAMKRERAMAYGYSNQLWAQVNLRDTRPGGYPVGYPWWWNRLERDLPSSNQTQQHSKSVGQTPNHKPTQQPQSSNYKPRKLEFGHQDPGTPRSTKSTPPLGRKPHISSNKTPPTPSRSSSNLTKCSRPRTLDALMKDDDSLASCPPFSVQPNYMSPTVSTKAKARGTGEPKRRFSLPLSSNMSSFRWNNKGSSKGSSVDSAATMPAAFGRKPFNRFV